MHTIMQQLCNDHLHMSKALSYLEQRLKRSWELDTAMPELWVLLTVLDYIQVYPERWHHPIEDIIFNRLAHYHPECAGLVEIAKDEHQRLESMTEAMVDLCNGIMEDNSLAIKGLCRVMLCYLAMQHQHMNRENEHLYPLINRYFIEQDWQEVEKQLPMINDPLFGQAQKHYEKLYREIIEAKAI